MWKSAMYKEAVVVHFMKYILELSHKKVRQNKLARIYDYWDENGTQDLPTTQLECQHETLVPYSELTLSRLTTYIYDVPHS
jgi:hypothetical protein